MQQTKQVCTNFSVYIQKLKTFIGLRFMTLDTENHFFLLSSCLAAVSPATECSKPVQVTITQLPVPPPQTSRSESGGAFSLSLHVPVWLMEQQNPKSKQKKKGLFHQTNIWRFLCPQGFCLTPSVYFLAWAQSARTILQSSPNFPLPPPKDEISIKPPEHFKWSDSGFWYQKTAGFPQCHPSTDYTPS